MCLSVCMSGLFYIDVHDKRIQCNRLNRLMTRLMNPFVRCDMHLMLVSDEFDLQAALNVDDTVAGETLMAQCYVTVN